MAHHTIDHRIKDRYNDLRIDVTRSPDCDDFLLLNTQPLNRIWPRTTAVISLTAAAELAHALLDAVAAFQPEAPAVPVGWESIETTAE